MIDKASWQRFFEGYFVRDCTLGFEPGRLGFLLFEEPEDGATLEDGWQIRLLAVKLANPMETRFFSMSANGLGVGAQLASAWAPSSPEFLALSVDRKVYSYVPKQYKGREADIPFDGRGYGYQDLGEVGCAIRKAVRVGHTVYAVGDPLRIFERAPGQRWVEHTDLPMPKDLRVGRSDDEIRAALSRCALRDLGGRDEDDLIAVGDEGMVWQRRPEGWRQAAIPTNADLCTVAVAEDGTVFITDRHGAVWSGRDDHWERLAEGHSALGWQDAAWFAGRLWCTNDAAGPFVLEGRKMVPAHRAKKDAMPAQVARFAHRIDVSPDGRTMLVAGGQGAATYDGQTWTVLFDGEP